jgi:hypothetical protein
MACAAGSIEEMLRIDKSLCRGWCQGVAPEVTMSEFHCPNCGAVLSAPNMPCPFCAEAQRMLQQLMEQDEVHLCTRCGALLQDPQSELCPACRKAVAAPPSILRRDDRIAGWIRDRFVEPVAEREGLVCPSCQSPVPPLAIFCAHCGYKLTGAPEATVPPPQSMAVAPGREDQPADEGLPEADAAAAASTGGGPAVAEPSWWQQLTDFWRDQFRPRGPAPERPAAPWYEQFGRWLRSLFGFTPGQENSDHWLWIVLGILMVGIAAMVVFWATLLRSGNLVFR